MLDGALNSAQIEPDWRGGGSGKESGWGSGESPSVEERDK